MGRAVSRGPRGGVVAASRPGGDSTPPGACPMFLAEATVRAACSSRRHTRQMVAIDIDRGAMRYLRAQIQNFGARPTSRTLPGLSDQVFLLQHNHIAPRPRRAHLAEPIRRKLARRNGRSARVALGIVQRTERGVDINGAITRLSKSTTKYDALLAHWGIHHLHVREIPKAGKVAERSGPLLFGIFYPDDAYFLDIRDHHSFEDAELLELALSTWPDVFGSWRLRGVSDYAPKVTSPTDLKKWRKAGAMVLHTRPDGSVYLPPGRGYMVNGFPMAVRQTSMEFLWLLDTLKEWAGKNEPAIVAKFHADGEHREDDVILWNPYEDNGCEILENERTGFRVRFPHGKS